MVRKQTCTRCGGNKYVEVTTSSGRTKHAECPDCGGHGFKIRVTIEEK